MRFNMNKIAALLFCSLFPIASLQAQKSAGASATSNQQPTPGIYEKFCQQLPPQADAEAVRQAILAHKGIVAAMGCDLRLRHEIESPGGYHYTYEQTWSGIPIYMGEIKANLNRQKRFMNLLDNLRSFEGTPAMHQRDAAQVAALLPQMLDQGFDDFQVFPTTKCYFLQDSHLIPAFKVAYTAHTQTWELILADDDLRELQRRDMAAYRKPHTTTDTTGHAMVFFPDPLTSSGHTYGSPYADNNDGDTPELNAQRIPVTLRDINWTGTVFELKGPYVVLEDREAPTGAPATSTDGNFVFTRSQQGFEDVMVYYHIDTFQRYVQALGFTNLMSTAVKADPHGLNGQDNSHFVATDSRLAFGEGGVDDAEDADVVIHEYGHALSNSGSPFSNSGTERQGLDEGIGDYVAATYSRGISYTFWKNTFTWDGHNEFWPGRSASNPTQYPPSNTSDIYLYGAIWTSTLMEVWPQIGKEATDRVLLESLYGHAPNLTLTDAALIHIDADSNLYGGAHFPEYQFAFCQRGILAGTLPWQPCFVGMDHPTSTAIDWQLFPNPAHGQVQLEIKGHHPRRDGLRYVLCDLLGREMKVGEASTATTVIDLQGLAAGIYLFQLHRKDGWMESRRLQVD